MVQQFGHRQVWDLPDTKHTDCSSVEVLQDASSNFELVVELPNLDSTTFIRNDDDPNVIENVTLTNDDVELEVELDNTSVEYDDDAATENEDEDDDISSEQIDNESSSDDE